ncbi:hypothetical protein NE237_026817 [Protea cynaroides]|uniref:Histidine-containing phosphotransfer protein n=1 Tax=Protea cynaroides TaxID=273540 RepID=A0A9Q0JTJ9_9MAGN|nr:hypothetical protein NE237_026817 [Protea cynaroides]
MSCKMSSGVAERCDCHSEKKMGRWSRCGLAVLKLSGPKQVIGKWIVFSISTPFFPSIPYHLWHSPTTMENERLRQQAGLMRLSFLDQGYLNEQFIQLEELQDTEPGFVVEEVISLFYRDSPKYIFNIEQALKRKPIDFNTMESNMSQLRGSSARKQSTIDFIKINDYASKFHSNSSSIGAKMLMQMSLHLQNTCEAENAERCKKAVENLKMECEILEEKLQSYFHLSKQIGRSNGASGSKEEGTEGKDDYEDGGGQCGEKSSMNMDSNDIESYHRFPY